MRSFCAVVGLTMILMGVGIASLAQFLYESKKVAMPTEAERIQQLEQKVRLLVHAIETYCDNPGCNIPARTTAIAKLRWAADEAKK
jgi:hypothetical protein